MITDEKLLESIKSYFESIKNNLPNNSTFRSAYKYTIRDGYRGENTDDKPLSEYDRITIYYNSSIYSNSSLKVSSSTLISYLRNKKLNQLGI